MDQHIKYNSIATLQNVLENLSEQISKKHKEIITVQTEYRSLKRQYDDLQHVLKHLIESDESLSI